MKYRVFRTLPLFVVLSAVAFAQDLASFEKRITVKKLNNGLTVVICERPEAPVFAFVTHVDAGSVQDPLGETGMAHMFEHMAFKGTDKIGTTDYAAEKVALQKVEQAYAAYLAERDKRVDRDDQKLKEWEKAWQAAIAEAQRYVKPNEFPQILESNGAEGLNAFTNEDETAYHYSLPENRLELWAYLESERFIHPVMREFYKERNVVIEERRMRTDSNPIGRLLEQFVTAAYQAHPYHRPTIGWMADLNSFSATDAQNFFDRYYIPSNMVVAIVGDVQAAEAMPVIEKYFGQIPAHEKPDERTTTEPPQNSERRVVLYDRSQPLYLEGYHRPDYRSPDDAVYDAIADLMSNGRTSRLYRALVRDKKIAADSVFFSSRRRHTSSTRDWSSDVCSSDLQGTHEALEELRSLARGIRPPVLSDRGLEAAVLALADRTPIRVDAHVHVASRPPRAVERSEERRVGKELSAQRSQKYNKKRNHK